MTESEALGLPYCDREVLATTLLLGLGTARRAGGLPEAWTLLATAHGRLGRMRTNTMTWMRKIEQMLGGGGHEREVSEETCGFLTKQRLFEQRWQRGNTEGNTRY